MGYNMVHMGEVNGSQNVRKLFVLGPNSYRHNSQKRMKQTKKAFSKLVAKKADDFSVWNNTILNSKLDFKSLVSSFLNSFAGEKTLQHDFKNEFLGIQNIYFRTFLAVNFVCKFKFLAMK